MAGEASDGLAAEAGKVGVAALPVEPLAPAAEGLTLAGLPVVGRELDCNTGVVGTPDGIVLDAPGIPGIACGMELGALGP